MINKLTKGLFVSSSLVQKDEDYCDDLNFLSEFESDFFVIENTFTRFENFLVLCSQDHGNPK